MVCLYESLVRPHLEFCISAWSSYYKDKELLERVQHHVTRTFASLRTLAHADRLQSLGLWSLEERLNRSDLLEVFRMYKGWSRISFGSMFMLSNVTITRVYAVKIAKNRCRLDSSCHFFSEWVTDRWDRLPQHIIDSVSLNAFKSGLDRLRSESIGFFTDQWSTESYRPHLFQLFGIRCSHTWYVATESHQTETLYSFKRYITSDLK